MSFPRFSPPVPPRVLSCECGDTLAPVAFVRCPHCGTVTTAHHPLPGLPLKPTGRGGLVIRVRPSEGRP